MYQRVRKKQIRREVLESERGEMSLSEIDKSGCHRVNKRMRGMSVGKSQ